jgi:hypothetical protein
MREVGWLILCNYHGQTNRKAKQIRTFVRVQPLQDVRARANQVFFRSLSGQAILLYGVIFHFSLC